MTYPNYKNKHLEKALFNPQDFIKYKKRDIKNFPKKWVITWQSSVEKYLKRKYKVKESEFAFQGRSYILGNIGVIRMRGIGSPHAVTVIEELIACGAKEFICVGTAGGLQDFGVFVCEKSIRDEGTSHHYTPKGKYSYPDEDLTRRLERTLIETSLSPQRGTSWTIDAPYRETKAEVLHYKKQGVVTVEMEASALFVVAQFRKVKIASAFVVSDILGEKKWSPEFDSKHVKLKLNKLFDAAIECLRKK